MLENVDRLLKSPASQRGRDFALMLSSLNSLGYAVEWRVIDASSYGMPQKRKRIFILAYKKGTTMYSRIYENSELEVLNKISLFSQTFEINEINKEDILSNYISEDLVEVTNSFNKNTPKQNAFLDTGYMLNGKYFTSKVEDVYSGEKIVLKDILQNEDEVPNEFYINEDVLKKWQYHKGSKSFERINKATGFKYIYSEGKMSFPDCLDKPARTIITGEGGSGASRFKHVICVNGRYRRLTPIELERANMFPDNHTLGVSDTKRAFLMGNALVVGIVERISKKLLEVIE